MVGLPCAWLREGLSSLQLLLGQRGRQGVMAGLWGGSPGSIPSAGLGGDEVGTQLSCGERNYSPHVVPLKDTHKTQC